MAEEPREQPAGPRRAWIAYAIAFGIVVADQLSKLWFLGLGLHERETLPVWGPLHLTFVLNEGVSFGLFSMGHEAVRWILTVFAILVSGALTVWAWSARRLMVATAVGLVIGGALGNVIDRIRFGAVVDFIDVQRIGFFPWIFNIADSAITIGVILLLLDSLRKESAT